eukprot:TRINITY_DN7232_c0_g1_i1.p1 TRINITY_DN7232_c0_g1~~TRINITY_DN7232_c0_g1_i1.p1  ORF type:complete len:520 (+),score=40.07 TRINITY_DN7232_c0_g1_i1:142-1701(+)
MSPQVHVVDADIFGVADEINTVVQTAGSEDVASVGSWALREESEPPPVVFQAFSITPQVASYFVRSSVVQELATSSLVTEETRRKVFHGQLELDWTLCNPANDRRLVGSLRGCLFSGSANTGLLILAGLLCCWITSVAADVPEYVEISAADSLECTQLLSRNALKALLLAIQVPMCWVNGAIYMLAHAFFFKSAVPVRVTQICVALTVFLALVGSTVVVIGDPKTVWGEEGLPGFAGIWLTVTNICGIGILAFAMCYPNEHDHGRRVISNKQEASSFALHLLLNSIFVQALFYATEAISTTSLGPEMTIVLLFLSVSLVKFFLKRSFTSFNRVPSTAISFMMFWFQVGVYLSFRLQLQQEDLTICLTTSLAASAVEAITRCCSVVYAKWRYNRHVRSRRATTALRLLDVFIADMVTDILAEYSAIAIAGVLSMAAHEVTFVSVNIGSVTAAAMTALLQLFLEVLTDAATLYFTLAMLPISLEGFFNEKGSMRRMTSYVAVTCLFMLGLLNLRIRIRCFA